MRNDFVGPDGVITFPAGPVRGAGGGGDTPKEYPNTYRTNNLARMVELIGEGEMVGLVNGAKSIYFDQTPLQNENGTFNFRGVEWEERKGLPDQASLTGNTSAETALTVETRVRFATGPVIRTIAEQNATAVRVVVRVPSLAFVDKEGNTKGSTLSWKVEVRPYQGAWVTAKTFAIKEKFTSPCQFAVRAALPEGGYPWDVRVSRVTADSDDLKLQNETWWESVTTLIEGRFTYPHSALVSMRVNAALFSQSSIPKRSYHVRGRLVQIPINYDGNSRVYSGIWNGTFKMGWTNNPAWALYDMIVNDRFGLGEFVDATRIDKWALYQIAQYCDELVPDGFGGTEPRYTFNVVLNSRDEAFKVLQQITTAFRGMAFWSLGQVFAFADMPEDPSTLVTPANVIDGDINYPGAALKARHSVALVTWNDPNDFGRPAVEVVIDDEMLHRFGWREKAIQAVGCDSRGLAHRYGRWALETEKSANDSVEYTASWDHAEVRPGKIVAVADPRKASFRTGGRLAAVAGAVLTLDNPFIAASGETYKIKVTMPDGTVAERDVTSFSGANVTMTSAFTTAPRPGAIWIISGSDVAPRQYRVLSINETDEHLFRVSGVQHDPTKFPRIEQNLKLELIPYTRPKNLIEPVTNLVAREEIATVDGSPVSRIILSWTPPIDFMYSAFWIYAETPRGFENYGESQSTSYTIEGTVAGDYEFYVVAMGRGAARSPETTVSLTALGWAGVAAPEIADLRLTGRSNGLVWAGKDCRITWRNVFHTNDLFDENPLPADDPGVTNSFYAGNIVKVFDYDTNTLRRTETLHTNEYTYTYEKNLEDGGFRHLRFEVQVKDTLTRLSNAEAISVENPVPEVVNPSVSSGIELGFVQVPTPADLDYAGVKVWISTNPTFDPLATTPVYEGANNFISAPIIPDIPHYVRVAAYDEFGRDDLNISGAVELLSSTITLDQSPPGTPGTVTLSTAAETNATGVVNATLTADWADVSSDNLAYYDVEIKEGSGNYISYQSSLSYYQWRNLKPGVTYTVRVRSVSKLGVPSGYTTEVALMAAAKTAAPSPPTSFTAQASLKSVFLAWTNPTDVDLDFIEVWSGTTNNRGSATLAGRVTGSAFVHSGLTTGVARYYWIRARNTSGVYSTWLPTSDTAGLAITPSSAQSTDLADGSIVTEKLAAASIVAGKIATDAIETQHIKAGAVTADKITVFGTTTLVDWRNGTDATKIEGGAIQANTIDVNRLKVGARGISINGVDFSANPNTNVVSWTAGSVVWIDDTGATITTAISAGTMTNAGYIYWQKAATTFGTTTTAATAMTNDRVIMAQYGGAAALRVLLGGTIIDGTRIVTGSITTTQIAADTIDTINLKANSITAAKIGALQVTADKINGGTLNAATAINIGGDRFYLDAPTQSLVVRDALNNVLVRLGKIGTTSYGLELKDADGNMILSTGTGLNVDLIATPPANSNVLWNSTFRAGVDGWVFRAGTTGLPGAIDVNFSLATTLIGGATLYGAVTGTPAVAATFDVANDRLMTVSPGSRYEFSAYMAPVGCTSQAGVIWRDVSGGVLQTNLGVSITSGYSGGKLITGYGRSFFIGIAPVGAASAELIVRNTATGAANPRVYIVRPMMAEAMTNQNVPSPWNTGAEPQLGEKFQITPSNVSTFIASAAIKDAQIDTVAANKILVTELSAFTANLGTVTAGLARDVDSKFIIDFTNANLLIYD